MGFATAECVGAVYRVNSANHSLYVYTKISMDPSIKNLCDPSSARNCHRAEIFSTKSRAAGNFFFMTSFLRRNLRLKVNPNIYQCLIRMCVSVFFLPQLAHKIHNTYAHVLYLPRSLSRTMRV